MKAKDSEWSDHRINLLHYVGRRVDDVALREDIVQEAIVKFWVYQAQPGTIISNVTGLLRRISLDLTRDHFRSAHRTSHAELSDDIPCPYPDMHYCLEQRQLVEIVSRIVKAMPKMRRDVFFCRRLEGLSAKEVAGLFGISPGAVDAHVTRAVLDLHRAIEKIEKRGGNIRG